MKHLASISTIAAVAAVLGLITTTSIHGFSITSPRAATLSIGSSIVGSSSKSPLFSDRVSSAPDDRQARSSATTLLATTANGDAELKKPKKTYQELRAEGGPFTFNTPIGALNPYAIYYFVVSVGLGIPWVIFCKAWQIVHHLSGRRFDPKVCYPKVVMLE
jgi:hypothetical protein